MWFFYSFFNKSTVSNYIGFGGPIDLAAILDFVDSVHDLIIVADSNASDLIREIATESGVDFDELCISICVLLCGQILYSNKKKKSLINNLSFLIFYFFKLFLGSGPCNYGY